VVPLNCRIAPAVLEHLNMVSFAPREQRELNSPDRPQLLQIAGAGGRLHLIVDGVQVAKLDRPGFFRRQPRRHASSASRV